MSPFNGCLKVIVIDQNTCLAWADYMHLAQKAYRQEVGKYLQDKNIELLKENLAIHTKTGKVDFIVAHYDDSQSPNVTRIVNGYKYPICDTTWIGDSDSANSFLHRWDEKISPNDQDEDVRKKFWDIFRESIEIDRHETVGDFIIGVGGKLGSFKYLSYSETRLPKQKISGDISLLKLLDNQDGGYSISCLTTEFNDKSGCALYFMPAKFGVILDPENPFAMSDTYSLDIESFVKMAKDKYGFVLEGLVASPDGKITNIGTRPQKHKIDLQIEVL